jgi:hypothetical protein
MKQLKKIMWLDWQQFVALCGEREITPVFERKKDVILYQGRLLCLVCHRFLGRIAALKIMAHNLHPHEANDTRMVFVAATTGDPTPRTKISGSTAHNLHPHKTYDTRMV